MDGQSPQASKKARRRRLIAGAVSVVAHVVLLGALLRSVPAEPIVAPPPMDVVLVPPPSPPPAPIPPPKAPGEPAKPAAAPAKAPEPEPEPEPVRKPRVKLTPKPQPTDVRPRLVAKAEPEEKPVPEPQVSAAELASAMTAETEGGGDGAGDGEGEGGGHGRGRCDMVRRLQAALRNDVSIRMALTQAHRAQVVGAPIVVWNGDWVRRGGEDGKGLAGVRQAIAVEVAFSPKPCREQPMRGLVLLRLDDRPGGPRVVLGAGAWRWKDLLFAR